MQFYPGLSRLFPGWIWSLPKGAGKLAVTFDDGPHIETTPRLLTALERTGICSTMFLNGSASERCGSLLPEIAAAGHGIANHGYEHVRHWFRGDRFLRDSIERTQEAIAATGVTATRLFRPPFGSFDWSTLKTLHEIGYQGVIWSLLAMDWRPQSAEQLFGRIENKLHDGAILLLHDGHATTETVIEILPRLAETVAERGWTFTALNSNFP